MRSLIFSEHNKNKFTDGQMVYVLGYNYKTIFFEVENLIHDE